MVRRNAKGSSLAEVAIASIILIVMALFALNIGTALVCFGLNDRACRDAARAAAQGQTKIEAENLAKQILQSYKQNGTLATTPILLGVKYTDFDGNPPDGTSPFVTVTTRMTAHSMTPLSLFGSPIVGKKFPLTKTYTFPIVKLKVASAGAGS